MSAVRWIEDRTVGVGRVNWLGAFDETTQADCLSNPINHNICYYSCLASGAGGWNAITANACQLVCISEACGRGILLTPIGMQKVMSKVGACLATCFADAAKLQDPTAREAANAACQSTCALATEISKLPVEDKPPAKACPTGQVLINGQCKSICPAGQFYSNGKCIAKSIPSTTATPTVSRVGTATSGILIAGLVLAGLIAVASVGRLPVGQRGQE